MAWGEHELAIRVWEALTRPAPHPVEPGAKTGLRLAPAFVEWMQGLPDGWVTDLGLSRRAAFRLLGNTVVPQQAVAGLSWIRQLVNGPGGASGGRRGRT